MMRSDLKPFAVLASLTVAACAPSADARSVIDSTATPAVAFTPVGAPESLNGDIRFTVADSGNLARYRVRERLMGKELDNDAVGETPQVAGAIVVDSTGKLVAGQSRVIVQTAQFRTDSDRRDNYVRRRLLVTDSFPTVELVPTAVRGTLAPLLATNGSSGPVKFELVGDLTVRGVTKPTTWQVTATRTGTRLTGTATTSFTFAEFGMAKPRVPVVLSVADTIRLEYDFALQREAAAR
jgi:polyisoprenoid-binding protein YceI